MARWGKRDFNLVARLAEQASIRLKALNDDCWTLNRVVLTPLKILMEPGEPLERSWEFKGRKQDA